MPPEFDEEDDLRSSLMASFEAFDAGKLTSENADSFEITKPTAERATEGGASGAGLGGKSAQHTGDAAKPPAAGGGGDQSNPRDRQRDEQGRFTKGEGDAPGDKPKGAETSPRQPDQSKPQQGEQQPAQDRQATDQPPAPPEGLSQKAMQLWGTATPEQRAYIAETEGTLAKLAAPMTPIFQQAKEVNVPWPEFVGNLAKYEKALRADPIGTMIHLANHLRVDLDELADLALQRREQNGGGGNGQQQQQQPQNFNSVLQPYVDRLTQLENSARSREQAEQQRQEDARRAQVDAIRSEMDAFSKSQAAPFWNDVKGDIVAQMRAVAATKPNAPIADILKDAYDRAVWANPATRAKAQAEQQRSQRSRILHDVSDHRGTTPRIPPAANGRDISARDEVAAAWDAYDNR